VATKKVIVIGLDGLEPKIVDGLLAEGNLPNLAAVLAGGGYSRVQTTYPAQTPVAWSTFSTGTNPGGHGIFDFLGRDPQTYYPILGLSRYEQKNAFLPPRVVNMRGGTSFWDYLGKAGVASTVLRMPCVYPPEKMNGRMIAGVGVPDLRGGLGTSTFYSSDVTVQPQESEKVIRVAVGGNEARLVLIGPYQPKTRSDATLEVTIRLLPEQNKAVILSDGAPAELEVALGGWSEWLKVRFKTGVMQSVRGQMRFYLRGLTPTFELYASPVNFDPQAPLFPISYPEEYASELQSRIGAFHTTGMAEDHDGLVNGRFDEAAFLSQVETVLREREKMMFLELSRFREGFFFCLFDTPDRLQHVMWRFREPDHPANRNGLPAGYDRVIEDHYRRLDTIIGKVMKIVDEQTLLIVLSDHGMNSFRRGLNLNTWLIEKGYLALKPGLQPGGEGTGDFFKGVDWSRSKAYTLGLGEIFLNLSGREAQGIVSTNDAGRVAAAIRADLTALGDAHTGRHVVRSVMGRDEIYRGPYLNAAPDLLVNFSEGYRVSWGTPLGGFPAGLFEDNPKKWAGDHVMDPALVPGVLFMNRPFRGQGARLIDLAPTILGAFGLPKGPAMEGENLL
jgi:predicted AlkP superfamily phosphohydrolase/phosphomutase